MYTRGVGEPEGRPFVRVNMITSLDGAVAFAGRSGALTGPADKRLFVLLRSLADLVMVGAGTVRAEGYGRARLSPEVQRDRVARGQAPLPPLAVVSGTGRVPWSGRLASDEGPRPMLIVPEGAGGESMGQGAEGAQVAEVLRAGAGKGPVDLVGALQVLHDRGVRHVLCEGGPGLNASLAAAGLVDELCLTLSPKLAGSVGDSLVGGWLGSGAQWLAKTAPALAPAAGAGADGPPPLARVVEMELVHVLEEEGFLFLRHKVRHPGAGEGTTT